jgi:hypothetical protein
MPTTTGAPAGTKIFISKSKRIRLSARLDHFAKALHAVIVLELLLNLREVRAHWEKQGFPPDGQRI